MLKKTVENYEKAQFEYLNSNKNIYEIAKEFKIDKNKFSRFMKDNGVKIVKKQKTSNDYINAIEEYKNSSLSMEIVAKKYGISAPTLGILIENSNEENIELLLKDKYCVNQYAFEGLADNEEKAYWLGFLYADGYNSNYYVQLQIADYDYNHLKKFRKFLKSNHPITYIDGCNKFLVPDKRITSDLTRMGCVRNKTYCCTFPGVKVIDKKYIRDFIRGFFDGDGCIYKMISQERSRANTIERQINRLSFTVKYKPFAEKLITQIYRVCQVEFKLYKHATHDKYEVYVNGQEKINTFLNCIYKESTVYLDRKYEQYLRFILPSDLEIDQIISAKLDGNRLPDYDYDQRPIRTEGVLPKKELSNSNIADSRDTSQGQSIESDA